MAHFRSDPTKMAQSLTLTQKSSTKSGQVFSPTKTLTAFGAPLDDQNRLVHRQERKKLLNPEIDFSDVPTPAYFENTPQEYEIVLCKFRGWKAKNTAGKE